MRSLAPIVFFAYNRPEHTRQVLEALHRNTYANESSLWIYIDGPKPGAAAETLAAIEAVKKAVREKKWCKEVTIVEAAVNKGLFRSISEGITKTINEYGKIIVMEDDVLVADGFLAFMNDALDLYENTPEVMHISGFTRPEFESVQVTESTYFFNLTSCWGWATWKRAWDKFTPDALAVKAAVSKKGGISRLNMDNTFEFFWGLKAIADGKFQSWNTIWHSVVFLNDGLCLHPAKSLVSNIGHDGSGTNCLPDDSFGKNELTTKNINITRIALKENSAIRSCYVNLHSFKYKAVFLIKHYVRYLVWF